MILEMMRSLTGRRALETTARRTRRFQPGLGLAIEGLELRLAPSDMGIGTASVAVQQSPAPAPTTSGDSSNQTVTNQDGNSPPFSTYTFQDDNQAYGNV